MKTKYKIVPPMFIAYPVHLYSHPCQSLSMISLNMTILKKTSFDCLLIIAHVAGTGVKKNSSMVGLWILFIRHRVLS